MNCLKLRYEKNLEQVADRSPTSFSDSDAPILTNISRWSVGE